MKVVIEVDKKIYQQAILLQSRGEGSVYSQIIANGTPLPKGHGDLIDRSKLQPKLHGTKSIIAGLEAPTVIPADKEKEK